MERLSGLCGLLQERQRRTGGEHAHQLRHRPRRVREARGAREHRVAHTRGRAPRATGQRLADEQRVAARDRAQRRRVDLRAREQRDRLDAQALQLEAMRATSRRRGQRPTQRMVGADLVVAERHDEQRRNGLHASGDVREHVDRRLIGPMCVLDDADRGTRAAQRVEHKPRGVHAALADSTASPGNSRAMSRNGPSGRGTARSSHAPANTRVARRSLATNARTRLVLPMPASPLTRATPPCPATTAPKAASSVDSASSRSSSATPKCSPPIGLIIPPTRVPRNAGTPTRRHKRGQRATRASAALPARPRSIRDRIAASPAHTVHRILGGGNRFDSLDTPANRHDLLTAVPLMSPERDAKRSRVSP